MKNIEPKSDLKPNEKPHPNINKRYTTTHIVYPNRKHAQNDTESERDGGERTLRKAQRSGPKRSLI
jgi:hypothetical protein